MMLQATIRVQQCPLTEFLLIYFNVQPLFEEWSRNLVSKTYIWIYR